MDRILESGASSELRSVYPYVTAPAWTSLFSGVNPGKHGVFDQFTMVNGTPRVANMRRSDVSFLWNYASRNGKRILALGIPCIYPAPWINGVFVSGRFSRFSCFPLEIERSYDLSGFDDLKYEKKKARSRLSKNTKNLKMRRMIHDLRSRFRVALELMGTERWDIVVLVDGFPDEFLHTDPMNESAKMEMLTTIDGWVGHVAGEMQESDSLLVVSDHGFGDISKKFYINQWLNLKKYLPVENRSPRKAVATRFNKEVDRMVSMLPPLEGISKRIREPAKIDSTGDELTKDKRDYLIGPPHPGSMVMTLGTRNLAWIKFLQKLGPGGGPLESEIISDLQELKDIGLVQNIYKSRELYRGEHSLEAPGELLVEPCDDCAIDKDSVGNARFWKNLERQRPGRHRLNGLFVSYGSPKLSPRPVVSIYDVLPTLLSIMHVPIPNSLDGSAIDFVPQQ